MVYYTDTFEILHDVNPADKERFLLELEEEKQAKELRKKIFRFLFRKLIRIILKKNKNDVKLT